MPEHHLRLRGCVCYWKDTVDGFHAHVGVAILVHDSVHSQGIALESTLPVVAVKVTMTPFFHSLFFVSSTWSAPLCN